MDRLRAVGVQEPPLFVFLSDIVPSFLGLVGTRGARRHAAAADRGSAFDTVRACDTASFSLSLGQAAGGGSLPSVRLVRLSLEALVVAGAFCAGVGTLYVAGGGQLHGNRGARSVFFFVFVFARRFLPAAMRVARRRAFFQLLVLLALPDCSIHLYVYFGHFTTCGGVCLWISPKH